MTSAKPRTPPAPATPATDRTATMRGAATSLLGNRLHPLFPARASHNWMAPPLRCVHVFCSHCPTWHHLTPVRETHVATGCPVSPRIKSTGPAGGRCGRGWSRCDRPVCRGTALLRLTFMGITCPGGCSLLNYGPPCLSLSLGFCPCLVDMPPHLTSPAGRVYKQCWVGGS